MYEYRARVTSVYDGDTFRADIDLGFRVMCRSLDFRMLGINAPEVRGDTEAAGLASRDALRGLVLGFDVTLRTQLDKQEKYGRWLARVFASQANGVVLDVNQWLIDNHFAVPYMVAK